MEEVKYVPPMASSMQHFSTRIMSPEIVEIGDDSKSIAASRDGAANDVYVAVGKDDLGVLKWALNHAVSPGARVFLVHVFPPITYIPTSVGRLPRSQLSQDQVRYYLDEEHSRRQNLLQKYIRLCADAKVAVDTMLLESNETAKAILDLIPVLNINNLVMGTKRPPRSRILRKKMAKGAFVKKNAPEYCEVIIVHDGKKITDEDQVTGREHVHSAPLTSNPPKPDMSRNSERKFFECACFSGKFD